MAYTDWAVEAYEQPNVDKWNQLGENDAYLKGEIEDHQTEVDAVRTLTDVGSAVNKVETKNSTTGNPVELNATGTDTNIDVLIQAKGTGTVRHNTYTWTTPFSNTDTDVEVGDGKALLPVPSQLNGMNLVNWEVFVETAGTTGTMDVQVAKIRGGSASDMFSTKITVDSGDTTSSDATTPAVIDTDEDDLLTGDILRVDVDAIQTTPAKGGYISLVFRV